MNALLIYDIYKITYNIKSLLLLVGEHGSTLQNFQQLF